MAFPSTPQDPPQTYFKVETRAVSRARLSVSRPAPQTGFPSLQKTAGDLVEELRAHTPSTDIYKRIQDVLGSYGVEVAGMTREEIQQVLLKLLFQGEDGLSNLSEEEGRREAEPQVRCQIFDIHENPEMIDEWVESIGKLMWRNSHQRLSPSQRKGGYVYHVPKENDWDALYELIENADHFLIMTDRDNPDQLIGFVEIKPLDPDIIDLMTNVKGQVANLLRKNAEEVAHLQLIVMSEEYRGKGMGKKLHYRARDFARSNGYNVLFLEVPIIPDINTVSYKFHEEGVKMHAVGQTIEEDQFYENTTHGFEIFIVGLKKQWKKRVKDAIKARSIRRRKR